MIEYTDRNKCPKQLVFHGFCLDVLATDVLLQAVLGIRFEYLVELSETFTAHA